MTKDKCIFKTLNPRQTAIKIYERGFIKEINKDFKKYGPVICGKKLNVDFKSLVDMVESECIASKPVFDLKCNQLNNMWADYQEEYLFILEKQLGIKLAHDLLAGTTCYVSGFVSNEIDFSDNTIFLNVNANISTDKIFENFIIMLTKVVMLNWWKKFNDWNWDYTYKTDNKIWLFMEIAIDSIFFKTNLCKISDKPSYKYFYDTRINGIAFMNNFRKLYDKIDLKDFLNIVFMFVVQNYNILIKFRNYLQ